MLESPILAELIAKRVTGDSLFTGGRVLIRVTPLDGGLFYCRGVAIAKLSGLG
ncbi:unnamed protein product [Acidithrix sp. C25]|nr:unnamed protein product [Acidithrix sp. C25]